MQSVIVDWQDATSHDEWEDYEVAKKLECHVVRTMGFLLADLPDRIIIALNHDKERGAVAGTIAIPRAWIQELKILPEL